MIEHPFFPFLLSSLLLCLFKKKGVRASILLITPFVSLFEIFFLKESTIKLYLFSYEIVPLRIDSLSLFFFYAFVGSFFLFNLYSLNFNERWETVTSFFYVGASIGLLFCGDLFSLFVFFEIQAISSVFLILFGRSEQSLKAAVRYLIFHIISGSLFFSGVLLNLNFKGSLILSPLEGNNPAFFPILLSLLINAACPPFHTWLKDAYPESSLSGNVYLSAFTTKSAIYLLLRFFAGFEPLIFIGGFMAIFGVVYALMENNVRRLLSYHIISQLGYMISGIGIGTALSMNGTCFHALNNIVYKGLLFMAAGAVIFRTHKEKLTELKTDRIYPFMPFTFLCFLIAALSISGFPFFNGFISKDMITESVKEKEFAIPYLLLHIASTGTFLSIALKLLYYLFFGIKRVSYIKEAPFNMLLSMGFSASFCLFAGVYPKLILSILPFHSISHPLTFERVLGALLFFGSVLFTYRIFLKKMEPHEGINLDFDRFYLKGAKAFLLLCFAFEKIRGRTQDIVRSFYKSLANLTFSLPHYRRWSTRFGLFLFLLLFSLITLIFFYID